MTEEFKTILGKIYKRRIDECKAFISELKSVKNLDKKELRQLRDMFIEYRDRLLYDMRIDELTFNELAGLSDNYADFVNKEIQKEDSFNNVDK